MVIMVYKPTNITGGGPILWYLGVQVGFFTIMAIFRESHKLPILIHRKKMENISGIMEICIPILVGGLEHFIFP